MKDQILKLIQKSSNSYWDKSEGTYENFTDEDKKLVRESDEKLADEIIKLFGQ